MLYNQRPERAGRHRIDIGRDFEIRYWTTQLKISEAQLRTAVKEAGPLVKDVKAWLARNCNGIRR